MESVAAAAAVSRTSPVLLLPTVSASRSSKTPTRMSPSSTRASKSWSVRTCASMHDQQLIASTVTTIQPGKNQSYPSQDQDKEMMAGSSFLELLEEEALQILNDEDRGGGREATDYNRRAQIFDKCSRVFQALKKHGE